MEFLQILIRSSENICSSLAVIATVTLYSLLETVFTNNQACLVQEHMHINSVTISLGLGIAASILALM